MTRRSNPIRLLEGGRAQIECRRWVRSGPLFEQGVTDWVRRAKPADDEDEVEAADEAVELVSLDEADAEATEKEAVVTSEDDIEVEDDVAPDDDTFLEEDEEGDDDVADLIDGDIEGDEDV